MRARAVYLIEALLLVQHTHAFHLPFAYRYTNINMVATRRAASSKAAAAATAVHKNPKTPPPSKASDISKQSRSSKQTTLVTSSTPIKSLKSTPTVVTPSVIPSSVSFNTTITDNNTGRPLLFSLRTEDELVRATFVVRPSKRNRSPYVADILLLDDEDREAIAHVPNLDMGGKCKPGVTLLLKPARNAKGVKVGCGPDAVSAKYGTPKCEFITQLLHVDESRIHSEYYPPTWVGAHPSLGERIAEECLKRSISNNKSNESTDNSLHQLLGPTMSDIVDIQTQIHNPCGAEMRSDFLVTHASGQKRIIEVKTVVDTDYCAAFPPPTPDVNATGKPTAKEKKARESKIKCLFTSDQMPYKRTAIFPWGNSNQKGPDGEKVVSTRAIHHVRELTRIANGDLVHRDPETDVKEEYKATILFVVIRGDAESFRPNVQACPSFGRYLRLAEKAGVEILVKRVSWGTGEQEGMCFDDKLLPIEWPKGY
jgi:hypothetical protein